MRQTGFVMVYLLGQTRARSWLTSARREQKLLLWLFAPAAVTAVGWFGALGGTTTQVASFLI